MRSLAHLALSAVIVIVFYTLGSWTGLAVALPVVFLLALATEKSGGLYP